MLIVEIGCSKLPTSNLPEYNDVRINSDIHPFVTSWKALPASFLYTLSVSNNEVGFSCSFCLFVCHCHCKKWTWASGDPETWMCTSSKSWPPILVPFQPSPWQYYSALASPITLDQLQTPQETEISLSGTPNKKSNQPVESCPPLQKMSQECWV